MAAGSVFVDSHNSGPLLRRRLLSHSVQSTGKFAAYCRNLTRSAVSLFSTCSLLTLILTATTQVCFAQRGSQQQPQGPEDRGATISVNLRLADHSPVEEGVIVNLRAFDGASLRAGSMHGGVVEFNNLQPGRYTVEVIAVGYQKATEDVEITLAGQRLVSDIVLNPDATGKVSAVPAGPPVLAPNAQKDLTRALEELRNDRPQEAKKHLDKLSRSAPGNPDVNYTWGLYYDQMRDPAKAKSSWQKTVEIYPRHAFALAALGQIALQGHDEASAVSYFERASEAAPSSPRFQLLLAQAYLEHQQYDDARKHAEHAIELGKDRATAAQLLLAEIQLAQNQRDQAEKTLQALAEMSPPAAESKQAAELLTQLRAADKSAPPAASSLVAATTALAATPPSTSGRGVSDTSVTQLPLRWTPPSQPLIPEAKWMPPDVDESMPAVEAGVACPLNRVQQESGKRVAQFVEAVNRITATEVLEHETVDRYGFPSKRETRRYTYVASIQEARPGMYMVDEYRNGTTGLDNFPGRLATLGLSSLVMIFHPTYRDEYNFTCEGLTKWHGAPAWQVHFRQRPDKPARLREYRVRNHGYEVWLRGRAWISADTFQIVSLETDIVGPIPRIRLKSEHIAIEYKPVQFHRGHEQLWLPESAEIFLDFDGHRVHRRHQFSNYLLFSVDDTQQIANPAIADSNPVPAWSQSSQ
jgi:tetratricopeptide (TPR) repeat protein